MIDEKKLTPSQKHVRDIITRNEEELRRIDEERTNITLSEFSTYVPLFEDPEKYKTRDDKQMLRELSASYQLRCDITKIINVRDDITGEVLFQLPPVYIQTRLMEKEHSSNSIEFFSADKLPNDPKLVDQAYAVLGLEFKDSQKLSPKEIAALRIGMSKILVKFMDNCNPELREKYRQESEQQKSKEQPRVDTQVAEDQFHFEVDE